ncbi:YcfL family protein [Limisphaera sp. 4302-co]|uniref:YcfL family protein n=1 Tax=Limisphaera sp. 4302-co TaxID=3400417 RepID=UPI003C191981
MKTGICWLIGWAVLIGTGCRTYDRGPYLPETSKTPPYESTERLVLLDPGVQHSVTCSGIQERVLPDGRLEVIAQIRNRENRRIEVQVNCVFKDQNGYSTGDETPFQTLILTENATEHVRFVSMNAQARKFTIRIRQAR